MKKAENYIGQVPIADLSERLLTAGNKWFVLVFLIALTALGVAGIRTFALSF